MRALISIFQQWDAQAVALWKISGDPYSGTALNDIDLEDPINNPSIKCDCTFSNGTICHITQLYASLSLFLIIGHEKKINTNLHFNQQIPFINFSQVLVFTLEMVRHQNCQILGWVIWN